MKINTTVAVGEAVTQIHRNPQDQERVCSWVPKGQTQMLLPLSTQTTPVPAFSHNPFLNKGAPEPLLL